MRKSLFAAFAALLLVAACQPAYTAEAPKTTQCGDEAKIAANIDLKVYRRWTGEDVKILIKLKLATPGTDVVLVVLSPITGHGTVFFLKGDCVTDMGNADASGADSVTRALEAEKLKA